MTRRERSGRALAVDCDLPALAVDRVLLNLHDVVGDIVHDLHAEVLGGSAQDGLERLADAVRDQLAVVPREVPSAGHRLPVILPLRRVDRDARQLAIREGDVVLLERVFGGCDIVGRNLVPKSPGARVNHHARLAGLVESEGLRGGRVVYLVDLLNLDEVVPRPEAADLVFAPHGCPLAHLREVRVGEAPVRLDVLRILGPSVSLLDGPLHAVLRQVLQILPVHLHDPALANAARDVVEARVDEVLELRADVLLREIRAHETHPA